MFLWCDGFFFFLLARAGDNDDAEDDEDGESDEGEMQCLVILTCFCH